MNKKILSVVNAISSEKSISREKIFEVLEIALESAIKEKYHQYPNIRVYINRTNGNFSIFRKFLVVLLVTNPLIEVTLETAKLKNKNIKLNDYIEYIVDCIKFDRITMQTVKKIIIQKVREVEHTTVIKKFSKKKGTIITGRIDKIYWDYIVLNIGYNAEGIITRKNMLPRENFRIGDRVRAVLYKISSYKNNLQLFMSRTHSDMIKELFRIEIPEISKNLIEIKAIARDPGLRSKIAVKTNDMRIDPVGACVGIRGARIQAISNALSGERIDVVLWDSNPIKFITSAMSPAVVSYVSFNNITNIFDLSIKSDNLAQAIGTHGQNIKLASKLTKLELNILASSTLENNIKKIKLTTFKILKDTLKMSDSIILNLIRNGFTTLESISFTSIKKLQNILGLSEKVIQKIQIIVKKNIFHYQEKIISKNIKKKISKDLLNLHGINEDIINQLIVKNIFTLEQLAEQNIEDFYNLKYLNINKIEKLIISARNICWFKKK